jgi:hypothetical protein
VNGFRIKLVCTILWWWFSMVETILKLIFDFKNINLIFVVCLVYVHIAEGLR